MGRRCAYLWKILAEARRLDCKSGSLSAFLCHGYARCRVSLSKLPALSEQFIHLSKIALPIVLTEPWRLDRISSGGSRPAWSNLW